MAVDRRADTLPGTEADLLRRRGCRQYPDDLPAAIRNAQHAGREATVADGRTAAEEAAHILLVDDEPDLSGLVRMNLNARGYRVTVAADGADGLAQARDTRPDLILLDVMMPVLSGWQVLRALKEDDRLVDIPVVMLTALSEERDIIRGHLEGAVRYITKPFRMEALLSTVEEALEPLDDEALAERRRRVRLLLQRLAELDAGRVGEGPAVRLSRLESRRGPPAAGPPPPTDSERRRLDRLTDNQREVARNLAAGRSARDVAEERGVSRSNIYALRKRIARKLEVDPDDVAAEAARLGLGGETGEPAEG